MIIRELPHYIIKSNAPRSFHPMGSEQGMSLLSHCSWDFLQHCSWNILFPDRQGLVSWVLYFTSGESTLYTGVVASPYTYI